MDVRDTIVLTGAQYGSGSARYWAVKGAMSLGTKAVIAKSFERSHCSHQVEMGIIPLYRKASEDADTLKLLIVKDSLNQRFWRKGAERSESITMGVDVIMAVNGDSETTTTKFIDSLKIPYIEPSFGDVESIVDQPTIVSYWQSERAKYRITDNLVHFSFGVKDFEDLKAHVPTSFGGDIAIVHRRIHTNPNLIHPKRFFSQTSVGKRWPDASPEHSIFAGERFIALTRNRENGSNGSLSNCL
ncbi:cystathionine gamma-synthase 1, chloroplastic [Tanacetum coccineum]